MNEFDGKSDQSEWNEQMAYSKLFFMASAKCRYCQSRKDVLGWKNELVTKMSQVIGVSDDKEIEMMFEWKTELDALAGKISGTPIDCYAGRARRMSQLNNILFVTEAKVDKIANKHMPFLKIRPNISIDDW